MNTFLAIVSFIIRLVFGLLGILACIHYFYTGAQLLSWKDKCKMDIVYGTFGVLTAILFASFGAILIVSLFI